MAWGTSLGLSMVSMTLPDLAESELTVNFSWPLGSAESLRFEPPPPPLLLDEPEDDEPEDDEPEDDEPEEEPEEPEELDEPPQAARASEAVANSAMRILMAASLPGRPGP